METLVNQLISTIENESTRFKRDSKIEDYTKAEKEFSELVKKGFAQKRGNNLLSPEDFHIRRYSFNTK